jgi:hypothetical protein
MAARTEPFARAAALAIGCPRRPTTPTARARAQRLCGDRSPSLTAERAGRGTRTGVSFGYQREPDPALPTSERDSR